MFYPVYFCISNLNQLVLFLIYLYLVLVLELLFYPFKIQAYFEIPKIFIWLTKIYCFYTYCFHLGTSTPPFRKPFSLIFFFCIILPTCVHTTPGGGKRKRKRETSTCYPTYLCLHRLLLVCALTTEPTALAHQDDAVTN